MERKDNEDWKTYYARKLKEQKKQKLYWLPEILGIIGWILFGAASILLGFMLGTMF